jgi:hypothetical protein
MQQAAKRARAGEISLGSLALFDLTGVVTYALMRRLLAARRARSSPVEPFRASARTVSSAHHQAAGTARR